MTSSRLVPLRDIAQLDVDAVDVEPTTEYGIAGVYGFGRGLIDRGVILGSETSYSRLQRLRAGQVVFSRLKAFEGAVAVVPPEFDGFFVSQEFPTFTIDESRASVGYIAHLCRWPDLWSHLGSGSKGIGARRERLQAEDFLAIEIPLPPIDEQQRIVEDIERWGGWEAGLRRAAPAESVAMHAIPGVIDGILRRYAEEEMKVGELVEFVNDLVRPGDDPAPATTFVGLQHVESHTGRRTGELQLGQEKGRKFRFAPGDIVYGYLRPYLNKAWIADRHGLCSVDQYVLRPMTHVPAEFVAFALRSRSTLDEANRLTHSLQLPRLRSGLLLGIPVPVPAREKVAEVVSRLTSATDRVVELDQVTKRRDRLIDALSPSVLNRAFAGLA